MAKVEKAKESELRELREKRTPTHRFTLNDASGGRRLSKRNRGKERYRKKLVLQTGTFIHFFLIFQGAIP